MTSSSDNTETRRPRLLVVDDDPIIRKLVAHSLAALDPEAVFEVEDGIEAQKVLQAEQIDVVITDVLMPNMDGRELMKWAQEHFPGPLWIVLSGLDTFDAAVDALHLGAFDFLAKPPERQRVQVAVRNALDQLELSRDRKRLHEELHQSNALLAEKVVQLEGLCRMLEDQAEVIHDDLVRAEVIQRALLPQTPPDLGRWCVETLYRPGSNVGGDFYDIVALDNRHIGLVVADAVGHGVAAAMLSVLLKHRLMLHNDETQALLRPRDVLRIANESLYTDMSAPGSFITAIYVLFDRRSGHLRFASAGHPPCIWFRADGECRQLERTGPALGLQPDARYEDTTLELEAGDRLLLYTDGVLEGGPDSPTHDDLATALGSSDLDRSAILQGFYEAATRNVTRDQDDITMVLLERSQGRSHFDADSEVRERPSALASPTDVRLLQGVANGEAFMSIAGNATWTQSSIFFDAANKLLDRRKHLTIDLGACEYLDSTFLGTLYEIVTARPETVRIQRVPPNIAALFEELSMDVVLSHTSVLAEPLPEDMESLSGSKSDASEQGRRILKAHEILASLSDENREQFRDVLESLRADLDS